jgi:hypothetical protein
MVITKISLARRTFLRGVGTTLAFFLDAMVPALTAVPKSAPRFSAIHFGNGANMNEWTPKTEGVGFAMSPSLKPLETFRDRMLVVTGLDNYPATDQGDTGGHIHVRRVHGSAHAKQTEGADVRAGTTFDQLPPRSSAKI